MVEILWHGRGGQGAFTAARLLGAAYTLEKDNNYALAFPSFGPERRGAPIRAFTKLDSKPIGNRSEIDKADYSIFLDDTLFNETAFSELKDGGKILLNTKQKYSDDRIITVDASELAMEILKLPITNTAMLGAFAALYEGIDLDAIEKAVKQGMPEKLHAKNVSIIRSAFDAVLKGLRI